VVKEHLDHSVASSNELAWLTGLPVLGTILKIRTPEDMAAQRRKRRLVWGSISGVLVMALLIFHFFYMDLWVLSATIMRLFQKITI
jgi:capsular polysaccharide biosynthesis protein